MKAYPLIYSRTKNFDFVPDFLARPKDLNCQLALKYVKNVMNDLDLIQGIRYTAFPVEQYCICGGIACISTKLIDELKRQSPFFLSNYPDVNQYLRDCKGRKLACFIGIAIPKSEIKSGMIPDISLEKYWEIYLQYLKNQWFNESSTSSQEIEFPSLDIKEKRYVESFRLEKERFGSRSIIKNYLSHEQQVLDYFFYAILSGNDESFITEIQRREEWDTLSFKSAVVSEALYNLLKEKPSSGLRSENSLSRGNKPKEGDNGEVTIKKTLEPEPTQWDSKKKVFHPGVMGLFGIFIIIIALVILLK